MSIANYVGRTVDILAFQGSLPEGEVLLEQSLAVPGEGGRLTTGINKLGQRFLIELFTETGSKIYRPSRGSTLMLEARQGQIRTQTDLFAAFSRALIDVRRNLLSEETSNDPADERFGSAEIVSVELTPGRAKVFVAVSSRDPAAKFIAPITISLF